MTVPQHPSPPRSPPPPSLHPCSTLFCNSVYWLKPHNNLISRPPNLALLLLPPPPPQPVLESGNWSVVSYRNALGLCRAYVSSSIGILLLDTHWVHWVT